MMSEKQTEPPAGQDKSWERAWDPEEMRKSSVHWSLAGDSGMLLYLQSFSQELLARTHSVQEQLNQVNRETTLTGVKLNNVFNDFIMLANTQFVENRVYDEDVMIDERNNEQSDTQEKTQEQREAELIPKITEALSLGLSIIDTAFEKLDVDAANSSGDEDENTHHRTEILLESKDPYIQRPLPSLIGSVSFMHDDNVGLLDESSDDEETEAAQPATPSGSESESEDESKEHLANEITTKRSNDWSSLPSDSESDGDLFETKQEGSSESDSASSDDNDRNESVQGDTEIVGTKPGDFMSELSNKLDPGRSQPQAKEKVKKPKSSRDKAGDDIFRQVRQQAMEQNSPPNEDDSPFIARSSIFSTRGGLFDDDQEEGDLFGPAETTPSKGNSAYTKDYSDVQKSDKHKPVQHNKQDTESDLFGADEESDDDLFVAATKPLSTHSHKKTGQLFGDDTISESATVKAPDKTHQSKTTISDESKLKHQKDTLQDSDGSSNGSLDVSPANLRATERKKHKQLGIQVLPVIPKVVNSQAFEKSVDKSAVQVGSPLAQPSLFDDDEDDLFSSVASIGQNKSTPDSQQVKKKPALGLFENEDDDDDLFSAVTESATTSVKSKICEVDDDLFTSSKPNVTSRSKQSDKDDLHGSITKETDASKSKVRKKADTASAVKQSTSTSKANLNNEDDLFTSMNKSTPVAKEKHSNEIFTSNAKSNAPAKLSDEDDLFATVSKSNATSNLNTVDEDDLFSSISKSTVTSKSKQVADMKVPAAKKQVLSLFDDENDDDDIFTSAKIGKNSDKKPTQQSTTYKSVSADNTTASKDNSAKKKRISRGLDLFGGDDFDDGDIFAVSPKTKKTSTVNHQPTYPGDPFSTKAKKSEKIKPEESNDTKEAASLFVGDDNDSDDDLFSSSSSASSKSNTIPNIPQGAASGISKLTVTGTLAGPDPLLGEFKVEASDQKLPTYNTYVQDSHAPQGLAEKVPRSDIDSDLFSGGDGLNNTPADNGPLEKALPPPKSKPAGAVSMFGGMDPLAVIGTRLKSSESTGSRVNDITIDSSGQSNIGAGSAGLASVVSAEINDGIDFDEPVKAPTLQSATKSRAKISGSRRLPSRHRRHTSAAATATTTAADQESIVGLLGNNTMPKDIPELPLNGAGEKSSDVTSAKFEAAGQRPSLKDESLPTEESNQIFDNSKATKSEPIDLFDEVSNVVMKQELSDNDDIFGENYGTIKPKSVLSPEPRQDETAKSGNKNRAKERADIIEDIFAPKEERTRTIQGISASKRERTTAMEDIFAPKKETTDAIEDIFASKKERTKTIEDIFAPKKQRTETIEDIFAPKQETKTIEDIFAPTQSVRAKNVPAESKPANKSKSSTKNKTTKGLFDDDDIFADSILHDDIFGDSK